MCPMIGASILLDVIIRSFQEGRGGFKLKKSLFLSLLACFLILSACKEEELPEAEVEDVDEPEESQEPQEITETLGGPLTTEDYDKLWPDVTKLVWIVSNGATTDVDPEIYKQFNELLLEKGANFVVEFIGRDSLDVENYQKEIRSMKASGRQVDLLHTGYGTDTIHTNIEAVEDDLLEPLDPYLQTEDGQKLFNEFDEKAWERARVKGTNYGLNNYPLLATSIYLFFNQKITDAYDIQLPDELENLAQVEDILKLVSDKNHDDLVPLYISFVDYKELSGYDFLENSIAAGYDDDGNPYVFNPFEQSNITSLMETLAHYSSQGYLLKDEESEDMFYNGDFFAVVYYSAEPNSDGILDIGDNYIEVSGYKLVDKFVIQLPNGINGIASWSEHKDEAFKLLMLLNTDSELSNLLYHGIEGKHYTLVDGKIAPGDDESQRVPRFHSPANEMLTHPIGLEPSNKEEVYKEWNKSLQMSPIAGFDLDDSHISTELDAIKSIYARYEGLWLGDEHDVEGQLSKANEELQKAGIDKVLDEINQQLKAWWEAKN